MTNTRIQLITDRIALGLSALCAMHCAVVPALLGIMPVLASTPLGDEAFHSVMLWLILPSSGIALTLGCRRHKDRRVMIAGATGLTILMVTALSGHQLLGETGEKLATLTGATCLALGHIRNYLLCRKASCDHSK